MEERFNIVKKGYDPDEVNRYIDQLEAVVSSYKEKDTAIKNALVSAQVTSEAIVGDASSKADDLLKSAESEAAEIKAGAMRLLDSVLESVAERQQLISSFEQEYNSIIQKYTSPFDKSDAVRIISGADGIESCISKLRASVLKSADNNASTKK